jgi:hypothetical protein
MTLPDRPSDTVLQGVEGGWLGPPGRKQGMVQVLGGVQTCPTHDYAAIVILPL